EFSSASIGMRVFNIWSSGDIAHREYEARNAGLAGPCLLDFGPWNRLGCNFKAAVDGCSQQFLDRSANAVERNAAETAAHEFYRRRTKCRGRQGDIGPAGVADLDETNRDACLSGLGSRDQKTFGAFAPEIIEHDVDAGGEVLFEGAIERIRIFDKKDCLVGAEGLQRLQGRCIPARCDDLLCAQMFGDLNGQATGCSGCAIDQYGFSRTQSGAFLESRP